MLKNGKFVRVNKSQADPACPYFADEFRNNSGDRYVAVKIVLKDLFEWKDEPEYPHKTGFRKGEVLYECDRYGEEFKCVKNAAAKE